VTDLATALPPFEPSTLVGQTLDGRYLLTAHLATGGMGAVFRAQHVHLRKDVAIKVLRPDLTSSPDIVERFRREAEIASALEHENIVRVTDFGRSAEGYLFLAMDLLEGESLFDRLRREAFLSPEDGVPILWQVCSALEAAHAIGVVHRDLKPENVFLARMPSGREVAKILDFGIAKIADPGSASSTQAGMVVGTPEYLSPEQALGGAVDGRADVYAVGLIAWRMLVGKHPFKAADSRSLLMMQATQPVPAITEPRPELAAWPHLVATIARACEKDVERRHQSAGALAADLAASGPGFVAPAGATPLPLTAVPTPPSAASWPARRFELDPPGGVDERTESITPPVRPSWSLQREMRLARLRLSARAAAVRALDAAAAAGRRVAMRVRSSPRAALGVAGAVAAIALVAAGLAWSRGRPAADARALLAAGRPAEARAVLESAVAHRPSDPVLRLLLGRALHRIPGEVGAGIEAYALALDGGSLDGVAVADLAADLGRERPLADRAGRLLARVGEGAVPAILAAAREGPAVKRLRALAVARDLGAEDRIDRAAAYGALLGDADCDIRRAAARRLGEIGSPEALARLRELAGARKETRSFWGKVQRTPVCGSAEAAEAVKRIETARAP